MQMSIENAFLVVRLTLFRLHTRPRRPYKARFVLQLFCVGVASNLRAVFSQCPRTLPKVVTCLWHSTLMLPVMQQLRLVTLRHEIHIRFSKFTVAMAIMPRMCAPSTFARRLLVRRNSPPQCGFSYYLARMLHR